MTEIVRRKETVYTNDPQFPVEETIILDHLKKKDREYVENLGCPVAKFQKIHKEAKISKSHASDVGYDIYIVDEKEDKKKGKLQVFGTGLKIEPPKGYYFDLVPRSSIVKTGYILANSVGIIDPDYRGEFMVPLLKIDSKAPDLAEQLPIRVAQLVLRKHEKCYFQNEDKLTKTERDSGRFGSTGT